ncbi:MAG: hypothetical protein NC416_02375 [Eubacterium sp.]|nr:hypothetical protein [Eubacterium sp.]
MTKEQFFKWNIITNICMALSINTAATILAGGDTVAGWVTGCCQAFTINTVAAIILPVGRIGKWFAEDICKSEPGKFVEFIARNFIINAIYVTIVSFCIALIHVGIVPEVVGIWWETYLVLHIVGFLTSLVIEKPVAYVVSIMK